MTYPSSTRLMNICLAALCKSRRLDMAELALTDGIRLGCLPDAVSFNTLISAYCNLVGVDEAYSVLSRMKAIGLKPNLVTYNSLLAGEARRRSLSKSLDLFDEIRRSGLRPDLYTFNNLIHCLFRSGHPGLASRVLEAMEDADLAPSSTTYNILLNGLCRSGDVAGALDLFRRLERSPGNPRSIVAYNILIQGLCTCGRVREARALYREIAGSGIIPNLVTYTIMMKSYFRCGRFREGFRILDEIRRDGIRLDRFACCTAIGALLKIGKLEEVAEFFDLMRRQFDGDDVDAVICNNRINFCFKQGRVEEALDLLGRVEEIDDYAVSISIDGLCKNNRLAEAYQLLKFTATTRSSANLVPYNCFIQALCKQGERENLDLAITMFNALEKKDSFTYTALLRGLSRSGRFLEAFTVMASGLREGIELPRPVRRLVLAGLRSLRFKMHARKLKWEIVKAKFRLP